METMAEPKKSVKLKIVIEISLKENKDKNDWNLKLGGERAGKW